ncbi:hypothetical protein [Rhodanobacter geophilus]|uniref:Tol-pal system protein YbgF n=1 Tax=Rhodanobacter geophilus TaxID=3162488 RepID=A0ABV3QKJ5_9GAMM
MRRRLHWLALAGVLAAAPPWAHAQQSADARTSKAVRKDADTVARQRAEVQRLQHDVAAQESGSHAAAQRLRQQDAEIAELQRQLQAAQQGGAAADKGH